MIALSFGQIGPHLKILLNRHVRKEQAPLRHMYNSVRNGLVGGLFTDHFILKVDRTGLRFQEPGDGASGASFFPRHSRR